MAKVSFQKLDTKKTNGRDDFFAQFDTLIHAIVFWSKWRFEFHVREELAQQVRAALIKAEAVLVESPSPGKLVKTICVRRCIDEVRRQFRQRTHFVSLDRPVPGDEVDANSSRDLPAGTESDPIRAILLAERAIMLANVIESLDATCKAAIQKFYINGLSYNQISEELGVSLNTIGARLSKCLDKLKAIIENDPKLKEDLSIPLD